MLSKVFVLDSTVLSSDAESFKRQEALFVILNLFVLAILLLTHSVFSSYWGSPPVDLIVVLAIGFFLNVCELIWVQTRPGGLSPMVVFRVASAGGDRGVFRSRNDIAHLCGYGPPGLAVGE